MFIQDDTIFEPKDAQVTSNQFTQCWEKLCKDYPETAGTGKGKVGCRKFEKFIKSITGRESESFSVPYTNEHGYKARLILGIRLKRP